MKKVKTYPKEYYNTAFEAYERVRKIVDYNKEKAHLKRIFGWLESMGCLSELQIKALIKTHETLVYDSGDRFWASVPFCPTGLSYNMFNRLFQKIELHKTQSNSYDAALEESFRGDK